MPYISVNAAGKLLDEQKAAIKMRLGKDITLVAGKTEKALMVDVSDGHTLYMAGRELENGAFVDVRMYGEASASDKKALTEAVFKTLEAVCGMDARDVYLTLDSYSEWGTKGSLY